MNNPVNKLLIAITLFIFAGIMAWIAVAYPDNIAPQTKFSRLELQEFKVRAMFEYYFKSGKMTKKVWYRKIDKHSKGQDITVHACSYCEGIMYITKGYYGLSHGGCYDCNYKIYKRYGLPITESLLNHKAELERRELMYQVFLMSG